MADFQQSLFTKRKISNGNAYDDIFGGPPKYSVPSLSSRVDDYSEIFGNFFAPRTSSIPIIDFPLLDEDQVSLDVSSTKFDYTEIFGGFDAGDFAVPYEEMLSEQQGPQNPSRNSWSQSEGATQQTPEIVSTAPLERDNQDLFVSSKMKQSFSNGTSEHIFDGTKQFNVSYNKSNQGSKGEPRNGTTHVAHLHDVPAFTVLVDSCPPPNMNTYDNSVDPKNDVSPKEDSNGEIMEENHSREMSSHILGSNVVAKTSENEIIPDEKHLCSKQFDEKDVLESGSSNTHVFSNEMPSVQKADLRQIHLQSTASEAAAAGDQHNSCNPIADLPSNGDKPFEKVVFLTISDINLRTQPSQLPPPSRPPPKLGSSKKLKAYQNELYSRKPMRTTETYHFGSAFDTCTLLENNASPPFFDVEIDASSAAAASAAAMREAMEKAQAKLKSAKESMERKRDGHQGRMKLNLNEDQNINEQRMSRSNHENRTTKDEEALDSCDRRNAEIKDLTRVDRWKMTSTADMASEYEQKMGHSEPTGASMNKWQGKNFRGSLDALKQEERAGEWKVEKQYYELINNEKTFRVTADQENHEKNLKAVGWNHMRASKAVKEEGILKNNETFKAFKESYLQEDCNQKPKVGKTACQLQENDNDTRPYTQDRVIVKKEKNLQTNQEALDKERLRGKVDNMMYEHNENEYDHNEACGNEEGGRGLKLAFEHEKEEKRWEAAHECADHENGRKVAHMCKQEEQRLKATCEHKEEEKRLKAAHEEKGLEAAHNHEEEEKKLKAAHEEKGLEAAHKHEEEEKKLKAAHEHEEEERRLKAACKREEEEKWTKAAREREEEEKRLKVAHEREEEEKRLKAAYEWEEEEKRLKAAYEREEEDRRLKVAYEREEEDRRLKAAYEREEEDRRLKVAYEREEEDRRLKAAYEREEEDGRLKAARKCEEKEKRLKAARELEEEEKRLKVAREREEEEKRLKAAREHEEEEKRLNAARERVEEEKRLKAAREHEEEEKRLKVARKLEDEKRLEAAFVCEEEEKRLSAACVHVSEGKGSKETHEHKEDILKYACETEEEKKRLTAVHLEEDENRLEATCIKGLERETVKASHVREEEEKVKTENQSKKETQKYEHEEEENKCKKAYDTCDTEGHGKNSKPTKDTYKQWINLKVVEEADEWEENGAKLKPLHNGHENEEDETKNATVRQQEESEKLLKMAKTTQCCDVNDKKGKSNEKLKEVQDTSGKENRKMMKVDSRLLQDKENEQRVKEARMGGGHDGNGTMLKTAYKVLEKEETESKQTMTCEKIENLEEGNSIPLWPGEGRKLKGIHDAHVQAYNEKEPKTGQAAMKLEKNDDKLKVVRAANGLMVDESSIKEFKLPLDKEKGSNKITAAREIIMEAENRRKETVQFDRAMNGGEKIVRTPQLAQGREREEKSMDKTYDREEREKEERLLREREVEKERLRKLEEEREREREREKDRLAVERATREARERASTEARERAERAAVERALAEARQRALADARERAEKASLAEKASSEAARLRVERAAVERATAEARERAAEKAAERAAARDKTDSASRQNPASDVQNFRGTLGESALRSKARLERHQRTVERAAKALAEKNVRDILAQREQTERNRLAETLDADIRRWASGKEGNLRALLSTLQYILGPESGWQPIPLIDVITAVAVKKAYRKATLCVHPDKVQQRGASIQHKYICEKVFDLLKEAWSRFNSEER